MDGDRCAGNLMRMAVRVVEGHNGSQCSINNNRNTGGFASSNSAGDRSIATTNMMRFVVVGRGAGSRGVCIDSSHYCFRK
jgi:hypothetical protein